MTRSELLEMFRKEATEIAERDFAHVTEATRISELGVDSMHMLEVIAAMERAIDKTIPDDALSGVVTVSDLLTAIEKAT